MTPSEYLHQLTQFKTIEELWHAHVSQMNRYGFDRLLYGYTLFKTRTSLGDPDDFVVLSNHSPEYLQGFLVDGLYSHAPMLTWALENEGMQAGAPRRIWRLRDCWTARRARSTSSIRR